MPGQSSTGSAAQAKQGAETPPPAELVVGRSRGMDGAHAVGAGERRHRRQVVRVDRQGVCARDAADRVDEVQANRGAAGVDGQSVERFAARADDYLCELAKALREDDYRPQAVKRVEIPKGDGKTRPLGIPTVKDRIVQQAVRLVIEPIFESGFRDGSYGFRPERGCRDALREVARLLEEGYTHVVDADLQSYLDAVS